MRTIKNPYDTSIISFQHGCSIFIAWSIRLKGRLMDFKVGVERTYGCSGFRGELRIHIISHMMRVVVADGMIVRITNIRHGRWVNTNGDRWWLLYSGFTLDSFRAPSFIRHLFRLKFFLNNHDYFTSDSKRGAFNLFSLCSDSFFLDFRGWSLWGRGIMPFMETSRSSSTLSHVIWSLTRRSTSYPQPPIVR